MNRGALLWRSSRHAFGLRTSSSRAAAASAARRADRARVAAATKRDAPPSPPPPVTLDGATRDVGKQLEQLRAASRLLDTTLGVSGIPKLQIGLNSPIGKLPMAGALAHAAVGAYALTIAAQTQAHPMLLARMAANVAVGSGLRAVPFVGALVAPRVAPSAANLQLLERHLERSSAGGGKKAPAGDKGGGGGLLPRSLLGALALLVLVPALTGAAALALAAYALLQALGVL